LAKIIVFFRIVPAGFGCFIHKTADFKSLVCVARAS